MRRVSTAPQRWLWTRPLVSSCPGGGGARRPRGLCMQQACAMGDTGRNNQLHKAPVGARRAAATSSPKTFPQKLKVRSANSVSSGTGPHGFQKREIHLWTSQRPVTGKQGWEEPWNVRGATEWPARPAGLRPDSLRSGAPSPALTSVLESCTSAQPRVR